MPETKEILAELHEFIACQLEMLQDVNPNLTGIDVTVTITPDAASGYRSAENSRTFYFYGSPARKVMPMHCPACRERAEVLVYSLYNPVPICEKCNRS